VPDLVLENLAVPEKGVQIRRGGAEDEILHVPGKENRRTGRKQVVVERDPEPDLLQRRRHVELEDRHFVVPRTGEVLILMIGEISCDVAEGVSGSVAETGLAGVVEREARQAALPDPAEIAVR